MNVETNQYDLNELFQFDLLKNILQNITTEQKKLSEELKKLKLSNKVRDDKIRNIEKLNTLKSLISDDELNQFDDEIYKENKKDKLNVEMENVNNEKIKYQEKDKNNNEEKQKEGSKTEDNKSNIKKEEDFNNRTNYLEYKKKNTKPRVFPNNQNKTSRDVIILFMKEIHSLEEKLTNLEDKLMNDFEEKIKKIETDTEKNISSLLEQNKSAYEKLDAQVNNLLQNKEEQNKKVEDCILKCDCIDIFTLLKDNGDGTVDATKLMVSTLEDKVFKKIGFIEERNKKEAEEIVKLLKADESNTIKFDKIQKSLIDIKYNDLSQVRESLKKEIKEYDKKISDIINTLNEQEIDLSQKISDLETNIIGIIDEKEEESINRNNENINQLHNNLTKLENEFKSFNTEQSKNIKDLAYDFNEQMSVPKNKINEFELTLKELKDSFDTKYFNDELSEIREILKEKITKENLKELYNLNLNNNEDISNARKSMKVLQEEIRKVTSDIDIIVPKVSSFMNYMTAKRNKKKEDKKKEIDFEQFVVKQNFEEGMKYFNRRIESIFIELESIKRNLDDLKLEQQLFEKKDSIIKMEDNFHNLFEENKMKIQKNRNDLYKQIKSLEVDIKSLWEEIKKRESSDNWILAKQQIKCFNCASCDNDIKIESQKEEYVPWNKIMPSNRSYRMGKGFSHMLEKMSYDYFNNMEETFDSKEITVRNQDKNVKNNSSTINAVNSGTQVENNKLNNKEKHNRMFDNIAQIERSSSQTDITFPKGRNMKSVNTEKVKLPQVVDMAKKKAIFETFKNINSIADKDKLTINEYSQRTKLGFSPKILKIKKKSNNQSFSFVKTSKNEKI